MKTIYVSDTNIWIDIRNAGLLDEMFRLPFSLCCTDFVFDELRDLPQAHLLAMGLVVEGLDEQAVTKLLTLSALHRNSSLADVSCYYLAQNTGYPLLTGDARLRKQAAKDGIEVFGVLWFLDQLVAHAVITLTRAADALEEMLRRGARLPHAECQHRLQLWR